MRSENYETPHYAVFSRLILHPPPYVWIFWCKYFGPQVIEGVIELQRIIFKDRKSHNTGLVLGTKRTKGHANLVAIMSVTSKCWHMPFYDSFDKLLTITQRETSGNNSSVAPISLPEYSDNFICAWYKVWNHVAFILHRVSVQWSSRQVDGCIISFTAADSKCVHSLRVTSLHIESRCQYFLITGNTDTVVSFVIVMAVTLCI